MPASRAARGEVAGRLIKLYSVVRRDSASRLLLSGSNSRSSRAIWGIGRRQVATWFGTSDLAALAISREVAIQCAGERLRHGWRRGRLSRSDWSDFRAVPPHVEAFEHARNAAKEHLKAHGK
jgi:hypothetical protein